MFMAHFAGEIPRRFPAHNPGLLGFYGLRAENRLVCAESDGTAKNAMGLSQF
jgi:hypothetical protein